MNNNDLLMVFMYVKWDINSEEYNKCKSECIKREIVKGIEL